MVKRRPPPGGPAAFYAVRIFLAKQPRSVREYVMRQLDYDEAAKHASDCAVHNGPALPVGPCDCGSGGR